jgi:hypothetical protein
MIQTLFILWFQGFEHAPPIVKKCLQSWIHYNPDWKIIQLDNSNIDQYIDIQIFRNNEIGLWHLSDIVRLFLLAKYGGLWVDATTFCNCSLTLWLEPYIKTGFFAFSKPSNDFLFSNWFIYSESDHYLLQKMRDSTEKYYQKNKKAEIYLIQHHLVNQLYFSDPLFHNLCKSVPVFYSGISSQGIGPLFLQAIDLFNQTTPEIKALIDSKIIPLFKLTHKCDYENKYNPKTILYSLFSTIPQIM